MHMWLISLACVSTQISTFSLHKYIPENFCTNQKKRMVIQDMLQKRNKLKRRMKAAFSDHSHRGSIRDEKHFFPHTQFYNALMKLMFVKNNV